MPASSPMKWIKDLIVGSDEEDEELAQMSQEAPPSPSLPSQQKRSRERVPLSLATERPEGGVEIRHPRTLDDRMAVGMDLKQRRMVALDLTKLPDGEAAYFLEFISGVVFALDAEIEKVTDGIFFLAPRGIAVRSDKEAEPTSTVRSSFRFPAIEPVPETAGGDLFWQGR
jgi:cell division inhibitor SepF